MTKQRQVPTVSSRLSYREGDVLLLIDVVNDLAFPGGEKVLPWALKLSQALKAFVTNARAAGMPVVYVNDNFGRWSDNFEDIYNWCCRSGAHGRVICRRLKPSPRDFFVLKPRHSGFFATSLIALLEHLNAKRLVLSGIATNLCVLFTAHDAHMHGYPMIVLSNCCAAESDFDHDVALTQLKRFCAALVCRSDQVNFTKAQRRRS